jgi:hypothetical protein
MRPMVWSLPTCWGGKLVYPVRLGAVMETQTRIVEWSGDNRCTSTEELSKVVKSLITEYVHDGREKRISLRRNLIVEVTAQPADANHRPVGSAYTTFTRDISTGGLRLISPTFVHTPFLILELCLADGTTKRLLLKILRCRPFRRYFEVGGLFETNC